MQSVSDKLHRRLSELLATMEDKLDCVGVLPSLQHQLTGAEGEIKKLMSIAPALEVDVDALKLLRGAAEAD